MDLKVMIVRSGNGALDFYCNAAVSASDITLNRLYMADSFFRNVEEGVRPVVHALLGNPNSGVEVILFDQQRFGLKIGTAGPGLFDLVIIKLREGFAPTNRVGCARFSHGRRPPGTFWLQEPALCATVRHARSCRKTTIWLATYTRAGQLARVYKYSRSPRSAKIF